MELELCFYCWKCRCSYANVVYEARISDEGVCVCVNFRKFRDFVILV